MEAGALQAATAALLARPVTELYADCQFLLASYTHWLAGVPATGPVQPDALHLVVPKEKYRSRLAALLCC